MIKVLVTSTSIHKLEATNSSFKSAYPNEDIKVIETKAESNINEEPTGFKETILGAQNRISNGKLSYHDYDFIIGIENGLIEIQSDEWYDLACIILEDKKGYQVKTFSTGILVPNEFVKESAKHNYQVTSSELMSKKYNNSSTDPHEFLTNGFLKRKDLLNQAILAAIGQYMKFKQL
jgi:non-canonical (house-cleaning) NTP pyrophosphatase